jgi:hypothetical protein
MGLVQIKKLLQLQRKLRAYQLLEANWRLLQQAVSPVYQLSIFSMFFFLSIVGHQ